MRRQTARFGFASYLFDEIIVGYLYRAQFVFCCLGRRARRLAARSPSHRLPRGGVREVKGNLQRRRSRGQVDQDAVEQR